MPFSQDFLTQIADEKKLSDQQREVFLLLFGGENNRVQIANRLGAKETVISTRLTEIYKKFDITDPGPVKERELRRKLAELQRQRSSNVGQTSPLEAGKQSIDELVHQVRQTIAPLIQSRCGTMRVLDMSQPIALGTIYTHVNILEKITGRTRRDLTELLQNVSVETFEPETFERFSLGGVREKEIPGLEAVETHPKLMILGKPGSGKTTFLKHLAIECIGGGFQPHRVPLFITLKDFAEADGTPDLLTYLHGLMSPRPTHPSPQSILDDGRALILLDGLDEVRETDAERVVRQIQHFSEHYAQNVFVITCRIAAREYTFQQFTEVEIADFDAQQIADFAGKWFGYKQQDGKTVQFLQKLQEKPRICELATSPLLLVLLCLVFEDSGDFPAQRWKLYRDGFKTLLKRRSHIADTVSEPFYKAISPNRRETLFRRMALPTFATGNYFFDLDTAKSLIQQILPDCLNQANGGLEIEDLEIEAFLAAIESQHGILIERAHEIYSFSHLTFHEYFTACEIVETTNTQSLETLASHITEKRWREVFLLTLEMLPSADNLLRLMKQEIDQLIAKDKKLQNVLSWLSENSPTCVSDYKSSAVRAFYLTIFKDSLSVFAASIKSGKDVYYHNVDPTLCCAIDCEFASHSFGPNYKNSSGSFLGFHDNYLLTIDLAISLNSIPKLLDKLQILKEKLTALDNDLEKSNWWKAHTESFTGELRELMLNNDWQFIEKEEPLLQAYYDANKLLVDCLRVAEQADHINNGVVQEIENTLLLPIAQSQP